MFAARPADVPCSVAWSFAEARPSVSAQSRAWKEQIAAQLPTVAASDDPVELQLCFVVGPRRNWANLWKPAIDALGGVLGEDPGGRPFHPRDDRVVRLGLHRVVDPSAVHDVAIGVWWRTLHVEAR
jgi:hypothetical protein